jgi:GntR family transcriptional regulator of vanillate catabolism
MEELVAAYDVRAVLEGLACRNAALHGLDEAQAARLNARLAEGDRTLAAGVLRPEDHEPYQRMNVDIHETLLEASGNPWVRRFAVQAHNIPFASDRIILWDDHAVILRSHGDHHRIVEAVLARDPARAEHLMREHVYYAGVILRGSYQKLLDAGEQAPGVRPSPRVAPAPSPSPST